MFKPNKATGSGFQLTFANGRTVSVQWGPATYSSNYDLPYATTGQSAATAEIASWDASGTWHIFPNGDTVQGYQTPDEVAAFLCQIAQMM